MIQATGRGVLLELDGFDPKLVPEISSKGNGNPGKLTNGIVSLVAYHEFSM